MDSESRWLGVVSRLRFPPTTERGEMLARELELPRHLQEEVRTCVP